MRVDLQSHPKIVRILSATQSDKFRVIGGLHAVWSVFDAHSENGLLKGYTPDLMDHIIGWAGFSRAMEAVGWLVFDGLETLQMPEFIEHNGQSAKRRAEDQKRKRDDRKRPQIVRTDTGQNSDDVRTREEKRREDINTSTGASAPADSFSTKTTDPCAQVFADGVTLLTASGESEKGARSLLGRLRRDFGDEAVLDVIQRAREGAVSEPKAFLVGALRPKGARLAL